MIVNYLWLLIIPYTAAALALHGGQIITGVNRLLRNAACGLPFAAAFAHLSHWAALGAFFLAFWGVDIGHENFWLMGTGVSQPRVSSWVSAIIEFFGFKFNTIPYDVAGMSIKGAITCPIMGFVALPAAYYVGDRMPFNTSMSEWLSGVFYGVILFFVSVT